MCSGISLIYTDREISNLCITAERSISFTGRSYVLLLYIVSWIQSTSFTRRSYILLLYIISWILDPTVQVPPPGENWFIPHHVISKNVKHKTQHIRQPKITWTYVYWPTHTRQNHMKHSNPPYFPCTLLPMKTYISS